MASTYSALKIELIGTGDQAGEWGDTTNVNLGDGGGGLEQAIAGRVELVTGDFTSNSYTLAYLDNNAAQDFRALVLDVTAAFSAAGTIIVPAVDKPYIVLNNSTGGYGVTVKRSGQTGVTIPNGKGAYLYSKSPDVVEVISYLGSVTVGSLSLSSPLSAANGGTGLSSLGSGVATWLGTPSSANLAAAVTGETGSGALVFGTAPTITGGTLSNPLLASARETVTIAASAASSTVNYDVSSQSVLYYTSNASGNWTLNVRGDSGTTLNSILSTGQSVTIAFLVTNGSTAYRQTALTIDGSSVTPKWQGGSAPSAGSTNSVDIYTLTIVKTASATFTVFESFTKFA